MVSIKFIGIMIGTLLLMSGNFIPKIYVFAQVITNSSEEADVYTQMSNLLDNIEKNLDNAVQIIKTGEEGDVLNILSNVTTDINEIKNGLNLIVDNPIHGGD
jgi:hypothetical protein